MTGSPGCLAVETPLKRRTSRTDPTSGPRLARSRSPRGVRFPAEAAKRAVADHTEADREIQGINAIRFLAVDAVNRAKSGHPGAPMGQAPIGYVLFAEEMKFSPENPAWIDRDRFVLSSGHGSMLQYALLHLAGYPGVSMEDIRSFRQWGATTPGHPENTVTPGVEVTTGPLGMGIANAVGLAAAEAHLAAVYNRPGLPLVDHYTFCVMGDGCMQEGISHEACALAGHLGLGKLLAFWDDNNITIDGHTELSFTEDVGKRFEAYGWHVQAVADGDTDVGAIRAAIAAAREVADRPSLIRVKTTIGYGAPRIANSNKAHGAPLGAEEAAAARERLGWRHKEFDVPDQVYQVFRAHAARGAAKEAAWQQLWSRYQQAEPALAAQFQRVTFDGALPDGWADALPRVAAQAKGKATRIHSHDCLNVLAPLMPELLGGSADLASSNMTQLKCSGDFARGQHQERNMRFGVREFGMAAIANGMSLHKSGLLPYCATFTVFTDYMRAAIRIAALSQAGTIFVTTHDSIGVGEDGPTHQPVETIPSLRLIPNLTVLRPADGNETAGAYKIAVQRSKLESRPTVLCLSRQVVPNLERSSIENTERGAYVIREAEVPELVVLANDSEVSPCVNAAEVGASRRVQVLPELILVATGSEVSLCVDAAKAMQGRRVRVVSMPSWEVFSLQDEGYKAAVLPIGIPKLSVEAASTFGWGAWADSHIGIDDFGASAPAGTCFEKFGFSIANVIHCAERCLRGEKGVLSDGSQARA